jgi:hypothetical protein
MTTRSGAGAGDPPVTISRRRLRAGAARAQRALEVLATVPKAGFETAIATRPSGPLTAVAALDPTGKRRSVARPVGDQT